MHERQIKISTADVKPRGYMISDHCTVQFFSVNNMFAFGINKTPQISTVNKNMVNNCKYKQSKPEHYDQILYTDAYGFVCGCVCVCVCV